MIHRPPHRRAFFTVDVTLAIVTALLLLMTVTAVVVKQQKAEQNLALLRAAARNAEDALLALQAGNSAPPNATVENLPDPAPTGHRWVRLTLAATDHAPATSLIGLVPTHQPRAINPPAGGRQ